MQRYFAYHVNDPERYGVVEFDKNGTAINWKKNRYNQKVIMRLLGFISMITTLSKWRKTLSLLPVVNWKLPILTVSIWNRAFIRCHDGRGYAWLDTGHIKVLLKASNFIATIEERQG